VALEGNVLAVGMDTDLFVLSLEQGEEYSLPSETKANSLMVEQVWLILCHSSTYRSHNSIEGATVK